MTTLALLYSTVALAQQPINQEQALRLARQNHPSLKAARLEAESKNVLVGSAGNPGSLELSTGGEEIGHGNDAIYSLVTARQNLDLFTMGPRKRRLREEANVAMNSAELMERELERQVSLDYATDLIAGLRMKVYQRQDSLYKDFVDVARLRYETQDISLLEYQAAQSQQQQVKVDLLKADNDQTKAHQNLSRWLSADTLYCASGRVDEQVSLPTTDCSAHPVMALAKDKVALAKALVKETNAEAMPKLYVEAGSQKIGDRYGYWSWQVGLSIPIAWGAQRSRNKAARLMMVKSEADFQAAKWDADSKLKVLLSDYAKWKESVEYYRSSALPLVKEQQRNASLSYREGAIGYLDFIQSMQSTLRTELDYLEAYGQLLETISNIRYYQTTETKDTSR
jgi:cobalt-zinc-cadmium resistance protein CzcA